MINLRAVYDLPVFQICFLLQKRNMFLQILFWEGLSLSACVLRGFCHLFVGQRKPFCVIPKRILAYDVACLDVIPQSVHIFPFWGGGVLWISVTQEQVRYQETKKQKQKGKVFVGLFLSGFVSGCLLFFFLCFV